MRPGFRPEVDPAARVRPVPRGEHAALLVPEAASPPLTPPKGLDLMFSDLEPSAADLDAIEREWPLIAAELDALDAEISLIYAEDRGGPTELAWRRVRRAAQRVMREAATLANPPHVCRWVERRLSDCEAGCKVMTCRSCGAEKVKHWPVYGCTVARRPAA
jgi:hypothetical protein